MDEALYRFYDSDSKLLYVGISSNWQARLKQHYKDSQFHSEATLITIERYGTRAEVEAAEKLAIETELPKYNKAFNPNFEDPAKHLTKIKNWVYSNMQPDEDHAGMVRDLRKLFLNDNLWEKKTASFIAYYFLELLPAWAHEYKTDCNQCIHAWHSKQAELWAKPARDKHYAAN
jgi:predicted GIY-YIG superfamily endonuclease